jgi:hypothetical protein
MNLARTAAFDGPRDVAYFNTSNPSLQLHAVQAAGEAAQGRRARPWSVAAGDWFTDVELAGSLFAGLIGADVDGVALVAATSYGFAVAAVNLQGPSDDLRFFKPVWSPDGRKLLVGCHNPQTGLDQLCILDANGRNPHVIIVGSPNPVNFPAWGSHPPQQ